MKLFVVLFAVVASAVAIQISTEYLPPVENAVAFQQSVVNAAPSQEYLPPVSAVVQPETVLANDGYRYKTVRRLRHRHRRDVNELASSEYLPPVQHSVVSAAPSQEYLPPVSATVKPQTVLANDGYRYKTMRRLKYRRH